MVIVSQDRKETTESLEVRIRAKWKYNKCLPDKITGYDLKVMREDIISHNFAKTYYMPKE